MQRLLNEKDELIGTLKAEIVLALQTVVARSVDPRDSAVLSCTEFTTDGIRNAIPSEVVIKGDTRSDRPGVQALLEARHPDPFAVLGMHADAYGDLWVRVLALLVSGEPMAMAAATSPAASPMPWPPPPIF